jgi:hypothetical protein
MNYKFELGEYNSLEITFEVADLKAEHPDIAKALFNFIRSECGDGCYFCQDLLKEASVTSDGAFGLVKGLILSFSNAWFYEPSNYELVPFKFLYRIVGDGDFEYWDKLPECNKILYNFFHPLMEKELNKIKGEQTK